MSVLSGKANVLLGQAGVVVALVILIGGGQLRTMGVVSAGIADTLSTAGFPLLLAAFAVWLVGLFRRAGEATRRLAARNYSWCAKCEYPFEPSLPGNAEVTCSECGERFRARTAREWWEIHPERLKPH